MLRYYLADIVVIIHLFFVLFVIFGAFLLIWSRKVIWLHLPAAAWGAAIEFGGWICPLTPLENELRSNVGRKTYEGGFVENYIIPVLYPSNLTREIQYILGSGVIVINVLFYWYIFVKRRKRNGDSP